MRPSFYYSTRKYDDGNYEIQLYQKLDLTSPFESLACSLNGHVNFFFSAVRNLAVDFPCWRVVAVDVIRTRHELSTDEVLEY